MRLISLNLNEQFSIAFFADVISSGKYLFNIEIHQLIFHLLQSVYNVPTDRR